MELGLTQAVSHNLSTYRRSLENLITCEASDVDAFREAIYAVWNSVARLYLDCVEITRWNTEGLSTQEACGGEIIASAGNGRSIVEEERVMRIKLRSYLESSPIMKQFDANSSLAAMRGLRSHVDYVQSLVLHLPEIYSESIRLQTYLNNLSIQPSMDDLCAVDTCVNHMGKNHISFVLPALEWLYEESSWRS